MSVRARLLSGINSFGVRAGVGIFVLSGLLVEIWASAALAAGTATTPAAFFNFSSVIGLNKEITATQVPVQTSTGTIIYKDVTIQINVDAAGNLTYATAAPIATLSPTLTASNIRAGIYTDAESATFGSQITGPAIIPGGGGEAQWSISAAAGLNCVPPQPATFYTGPLADSPLAARVKKALITATQYSFGVVDGASCGDANWRANGLIGVTAVGNQVMVSSFTNPSGVDTTAPVETIIYNFLK
ncbi:MAG TPA: hypothetical protein VKB84_17095 [Candidatus Binataceae bacterium]|nr:hypothetical protein [Candidatus Binataceae bacterium]